jgi:hypothetical protein
MVRMVENAIFIPQILFDIRMQVRSTDRYGFYNLLKYLYYLSDLSGYKIYAGVKRRDLRN